MPPRINLTNNEGSLLALVSGKFWLFLGLVGNVVLHNSRDTLHHINGQRNKIVTDFSDFVSNPN